MLSETQKHHFETLGFIILKGLIPRDEVQLYADAFEYTLVSANGGEAWARAPVRHQVLPFFRHNPEVYNRLLDDNRIIEVLEDLIGEGFVFTVSEAIKHWTGTAWHHDAIAADTHTHLKVLLFLDPTTVDTGCLYLLPGSQFHPYRERMQQYGNEILPLGKDVPGAHPCETEPGDVIVFNVKTYHGAFPDGSRRGLYLNFMQKPQTDADIQYVWDVGGQGGWYTPELYQDAPPQRQSMLAFWADRVQQNL